MSKISGKAYTIALASLMAPLLGIGIVYAEEIKHVSSYLPVDIKETFQSIYGRMTAQKPAIEAAHQTLLAQRYDLSDHSANATMSKGKAIQEGVRVKLTAGTTWDQLASMPADEIKERGIFPKGFLPLPHPNHPEGGMVFPQMEI